MMNFVLVLAAAAGLVCGAWVDHLAREHVVAAVVAVLVALGAMHGLAWLLFKLASMGLERTRRETRG